MAELRSKAQARVDGWDSLIFLSLWSYVAVNVLEIVPIQN